jgi:hypothetical protein
MEQSFYVQLDGKIGQTNEPIKIVSCSNPLLSQQFKSSFRMPNVNIFAIDVEQDSKVDLIYVNITIPLLPNEEIYNIRVALGMDFNLDANLRIKSKSLLYVDHSNPLSIKSLYTDGFLKLSQRGLLMNDINYSQNDPVFPTDPIFWSDLISHDLDKNRISLLT